MIVAFCVFLAAAAVPAAAAAEPEQPDSPWVTQVNGELRIPLYFFYTRTCPHCLRADPFVRNLADELSWLELHDQELTRTPEAARLYMTLAKLVNEEATSVPAFLFCGQMLTGFDTAEGTGAELREALEDCHLQASSGGHPAAVGPVASVVPAAPDSRPQALPLLGEVDMTQWSLPAVAVVLGALDSFNPCAFFVLLFLLSLLVNARSRVRMLMVGGLFVLVSGGVYFLFMAAWLNLFLIVGQLGWVTIAAGLLAVLIGVLNVKDYFYFNTGPSLSMPASARPGLFRRMRGLVGARSLTTMLAGTLALAVVANAYELLCTAGFPMVFTRLLTLEPLPPLAYYGYLALYCAVYVVPLLIIVTLFVVTLGRRKLSEREGRILKLVSGTMMLGLGLLLLVDPALLARVEIAAGLLAGTVILSWLIVRLAPAITKSA
jgi:hypothetical protein